MANKHLKKKSIMKYLAAAFPCLLLFMKKKNDQSSNLIKSFFFD